MSCEAPVSYCKNHYTSLWANQIQFGAILLLRGQDDPQKTRFSLLKAEVSLIRVYNSKTKLQPHMLLLSLVRKLIVI